MPIVATSQPNTRQPRLSALVKRARSSESSVAGWPAPDMPGMFCSTPVAAGCPAAAGVSSGQQVGLQPLARRGVEAKRPLGEGFGAAVIGAHHLEGRLEIGRARLDDGGAGVDIELGIAADMAGPQVVG